MSDDASSSTPLSQHDLNSPFATISSASADLRARSRTTNGSIPGPAVAANAASSSSLPPFNSPPINASSTTGNFSAPSTNPAAATPTAAAAADATDADAELEARVRAEQRARHQQRQAKHSTLLDNLVRNIDIIVYAQFSALYYMDCSLLLFLVRAVPHWLFFTPKPAFFPPSPTNRPYVANILATNILCLFCHMFFAAPMAGEAARGYLHGGFLIDFVGELGPVSKARLVGGDLLILALQLALLAVVGERESVKRKVEGVGGVGADGVDNSTRGDHNPSDAGGAEGDARRQDYDAEEQGVRRDAGLGVDLQDLEHGRQNNWKYSWRKRRRRRRNFSEIGGQDRGRDVALRDEIYNGWRGDPGRNRARGNGEEADEDGDEDEDEDDGADGYSGYTSAGSDRDIDHDRDRDNDYDHDYDHKYDYEGEELNTNANGRDEDQTATTGASGLSSHYHDHDHNNYHRRNRPLHHHHHHHHHISHRAPSRQREHALDPFYSGQFVIAELHIWAAMKRSWLATFAASSGSSSAGGGGGGAGSGVAGIGGAGAAGGFSFTAMPFSTAAAAGAAAAAAPGPPPGSI